MRDLRLYECPENRSCGRHRAGTAKGTEIYGWAGFKLGLYSMRSLFFTGLRLDESPEGQAPQLLTLGRTFLSTRHETFNTPFTATFLKPLVHGMNQTSGAELIAFLLTKTSLPNAL